MRDGVPAGRVSLVEQRSRSAMRAILLGNGGTRISNDGSLEQSFERITCGETGFDRRRLGWTTRSSNRVRLPRSLGEAKRKPPTAASRGPPICAGQLDQSARFGRPGKARASPRRRPALAPASSAGSVLPCKAACRSGGSDLAPWSRRPTYVRTLNRRPTGRSHDHSFYWLRVGWPRGTLVFPRFRMC